MSCNSKCSVLIFKPLFKSRELNQAFFSGTKWEKDVFPLQGIRDRIGCNGKIPRLLVAMVNSWD